MFHRTRDTIEAHLTIVFTALAVSRTVQNKTGRAVANVINNSGPCTQQPSPWWKMVERSDGGKLAANLTWLISLVRDFWVLDLGEDGLLLRVDVGCESLCCAVDGR
jgi:hypothetical protein